MSFDRVQGALQNVTSQGTPRGHNRLLEGVLSEYLKGVCEGWWRVEGGPPPLRYRKITESYTIVKTLNPQKFFDFETMKNFLKGDGLGRFLKSTT